MNKIKKIITYKSLPRHASKLEKNNNIEYGKGTPSCTCRQSAPAGSMTIEAAVIFPLVATFLVCFLFFFRVMQVQMAVDESLVYAGRMTAVEYSAVDKGKDAIGLISAEAYFRKELKQYPLVHQFVKGGTPGISLINSKFDNDYVELCAEYKMKIPVGLLPVKDVALVQRTFQRKWTGKTIDGEEFDPYVYVAETGSVYHTSANCHYIDLSIKSVEYRNIAGLRNLSGHKYSACSCAAAIKNPGAVVFITNYGTCYHSSLGCSGLKRTVKMVHKSEVNGMPECSKCGSTE